MHYDVVLACVCDHYELVFSMFSGDIGGSIGLWIGASALSVFEILDVFTVNFIKFNLLSKKNN